MVKLLELQSGVSGGVGEGRYTAVIFVSPAVENHGIDSSFLGSFSKSAAYFASSLFIACSYSTQVSF
tara:strand:- start:4508 stop:4708 length:201 start_codon:yes stop_codon:yes gene_type:complete